MTNRIIDTSGRYAPTQHEAAAEIVQVDPGSLPQAKPDAYANVDVTDFSTAGEMSRREMITMAEVAAFRGESAIATRWKLAAQGTQVVEDRAVDAARMKDMLAPKPYVFDAGPIVEQKPIEPWSGDPAFVKAQAKVARAQRKADRTQDGTSSRVEANGTVQVAQAELRDVVASLQASMGWTESEQRSLDAQASLRDKSDAISKMMGIPT